MKIFVPGRICLFGEHSDWAGGYRRINADVERGYTLICGTDQGIHADSLGSNPNSGALKGQGEVNVPVIDAVDADQQGGNDATDPALSGALERTTATRSGFSGLNVTATNRDDIEAFTMSVAGGTVGVAISAGVNVVSNTTQAYIGLDENAAEQAILAIGEPARAPETTGVCGLPVDWNNDGDQTDVGINADVDDDGNNTSTVTDFANWRALDLRGPRLNGSVAP